MDLSIRPVCFPALGPGRWDGRHCRTSGLEKWMNLLHNAKPNHKTHTLACSSACSECHSSCASSHPTCWSTRWNIFSGQNCRSACILRNHSRVLPFWRWYWNGEQWQHFSFTHVLNEECYSLWRCFLFITCLCKPSESLIQHWLPGCFIHVLLSDL